MSDKQKQYPLSPNTIWWKALKKLNPEERVEILQETTIWDDAYKINDEVYWILWENIGTKQILEKIEDKNHPRALWLKQWLQNPDNQKWYDDNIWKNFNLLDWGRIELLWDIFKAEDEKAEPNGQDIFEYNWNILFNRYSAEKQQTIWKWKIPNWEKYIDFLPWNDKNKSDFLQKVLWLSFAGYYRNYNHNLLGRIVGYYWSEFSNTGVNLGSFMKFNTDYIRTNLFIDRFLGFSLRLIEN